MVTPPLVAPMARLDQLRRVGVPMPGHGNQLVLAQRGDGLEVVIGHRGVGRVRAVEGGGPRRVGAGQALVHSAEVGVGEHLATIAERSGTLWAMTPPPPPSPSPPPAEEPPAGPAINAVPNGPLVVSGDVALYRRRAVESEHGEPLAWETTDHLEAGAGDRYLLCRCGLSAHKPYCDASHRSGGFVTEDHAGSTYDERAKLLGGVGVRVRDDRSICVHAGFCGTRVTNVWKQVAETEESTVRAQVIAMIEKCPSGALTFAFEGDDVEPLLPQAIAVLDDGPLWVTGGVRVSVGGTAVEARNRVTLCRCGASANKPLCDGSHKEVGFADRPGAVGGEPAAS